VEYPVVPELRGTRVYWYMRKMLDGQKYNIYLGPVGSLSPKLLRNAAIQIAAAASPAKQEDGAS
jgi:hypothetical protein